jgi:predicted ATPase
LAVAWSRGFAAEETKVAFTRASELSASTDNSDERFTTLYGRWVTSLQRGELDLAREVVETFLREAESAGRRGDAQATKYAAQALTEISREYGLAHYLSFAAIYSAWARARLGDREVGVTEFRQALAAYREQGNKLWVPFYRGLLAEIEAEDQDADAALAHIDEALALAGETGERWSDAHLHRMRGEALLKRYREDTALAEKAFLTAIAVARQQNARSFELRAAICIARLWRDQGKRDEARDLLAPVYGWFTEGFDTRDLKEARVLLDELAA